MSIPTITANYTPTSFPPIDDTFTASPTQAGLISGCKSFYQAREVCLYLQFRFGFTFYGISNTHPRATTAARL